MSTYSSIPVLALYDFRSKQEYIYRTNKIQEITGASRLLEGIYEKMTDCLNKEFGAEKSGDEALFLNNSESFIRLDDFMKGSCLGQVLYKGGGSLMMLFRDEDTYLKANRIMSRRVLELSHTLQLIAAHIEIKDPSDFNSLRKELYEKLAHTKRALVSLSPCNVTPFTHVDIATHQPVVERRKINNEGELELTREGALKRNAYSREYSEADNETKNLDSAVTEKGEESLLAVIYIDGNNIGQELMNVLSGKEMTFDDGVQALRKFSADIHKKFVTRPFERFDKWINDNKKYLESILGSKWYYRRVIGGGDEITVICNARIALRLVQLYFDALSESGKSSACAGISIFHSHAPFASAYDIAEECCENAKALAKEGETPANCFDFFFCRSGLTNDLHGLRSKEDGHVTGLPYNVESFMSDVRTKIIPLFRAIGRSNVKALNTAILKGEDYYMYEVDRINAYCGRTVISREEAPGLKKLIFDASGVYDIWFADDIDYGKKEADNK